MSEHDDIRRALEELSSHGPQRDRKPAVYERIAVVRRRRQMAGGVSLSVLTLVSAVAFAAMPGRNAGIDDSFLVTSDTPSPPAPPAPSAPSRDPVTPPPPPSSQVPTATPTATTPPRTRQQTVAPNVGSASASTATVPAAKPGNAIVAQPAATTVPTLAATTPSTVRVLPSNVVPVPVSSVAVAPSAAPTATATATAGPSAKPSVAASTTASSTVSATPVSSSPVTSPAAPGEVLDVNISAVTSAEGAAPETTVTVKVHGMIVGSLDRVTVWYTKVHRVGYTDTQAVPCTPRDGQLRVVDETFVFRTRYRAAGETQIDVAVTTLDERCAPPAQERAWPFSESVVIPLGSALSNGVESPVLSVGAQVEGSRIIVNANASDADGYVSEFVVNWGTGAPVSFPGGNGANCEANEIGGIFWPDLNGSGRFESPVMTPGTYTVTVTATSTGCDRKSPQTDTKSLVVTIR